MRARRELRRKQERAIAALQFANGKLACAGQRRTKAAVVARRIALLARFVRNNCGAPADGHVDHPGLFGGRTAETRKPGLDLQVLAVLQVLHCFFLIDLLFGLAGENDTRCCSYGPSRCESFRRPPSRSGSNRLRPSHQNHLRCVRLIKIGRTSGRRRIKAHLLVRSTDRPALTASHQVWPIALTAIEARGGPNMLRVRSQRVTMNAQRHGRRAHSLSRTKQIVLRTRHHPATMFDPASPDDVVNEIDQRGTCLLSCGCGLDLLNLRPSHGPRRDSS